MRTTLLLLPLAVLAGCGPRPTAATKPGTPDLDFPVGSFSLTERSGKTVTEKDLAGTVWVASFVFTRCMGPCPAVTGTVKELATELRDMPDVRFVTFTVDPSRDNPGELQKYAAKYGADPERWLFLTGPEPTIHSLMKDRFKLAVGRKEGDVKEGDEFDHSTRLTVVDKKGVIRATFEGMRNDLRPDGQEVFTENLKRMKETVRRLVAE
ncbi:MAG TPA: SCO family protein [Urbifossiella sp.]|jgi:cytochrome oxidase Cu insertion factor (SCO1/SenC/PrrC family)|nr:SCO family protein [Urbifossiella sp.]